MDRAATAEWILSRVVGSLRAAEVVGDQLEADPHASSLQFWMSVGWQVIAFTWRTVLGIICGSMIGLWSWFPIDTLWQHFVGVPPTGMMIWFTGLSMLLWCSAAFSAVRFGLRSRMFGLGILSALLASFTAILVEAPTGRIVVLLGTGALIGFNAYTRKQRAVLATFVVSVTAALMIGFVALQLQGTLNPPSKWPFLLGLVLIPLTQGFVASRLSDRSGYVGRFVERAQ